MNLQFFYLRTIVAFNMAISSPWHYNLAQVYIHVQFMYTDLGN